MGLEKGIKSGKEKRKEYHGPKFHVRACRNHGGCKYCEDNRKFADTKRRKAADMDLKDELQAKKTEE